MKHLLLAFILLSTSTYAQRIIDSVNINYQPYKGKLIVINEIHSVKTNNDVYYDIVTEIAKQLDKGDTINFIVEYPYSLSTEINRIVKEKDTGTIPHQYNYKNLPVRFIGVDFERVYIKENNTYLPLLARLISTLKEKQLLTKELQDYYDLAEKRYVVLKDNTRRPIIKHYKKEKEKFSPGSIEHKTITELLFLLTANHKQLPNMKKRDGLNYKRLLEADQCGLIAFKNNYNILVHGTCHTDPKINNDIYNLFHANNSSPFKNNTFMITQTYIQCMSMGDYFRDTARMATGSLYCKASDIPITDHFANIYKGKLLPGDVLKTISGNSLSDVKKYKDRILAWYIHWKTPVSEK